MTGCRAIAHLLPAVPVMILLGAPLAGAQNQISMVQARLEPVAGKTLRGEVMSVGREPRVLVVRIAERGGTRRDCSIVLDDRSVLKKLPTPISGRDLAPGHLVEVVYREEAGQLVARRIEVTGKRVHEPMP